MKKNKALDRAIDERMALRPTCIPSSTTSAGPVCRTDPPLECDLLAAIEHASESDDWALDDFNLHFEGCLSVDELYKFDDVDAWLELSAEEFEGEPLQAKKDALTAFRGKAWANMAMNWLRTGVPPVVVITATCDEGATTQIGDGRGRVNFAAIMGLKLPVWHLVFKRAPKVV